jgi:hypothetical protein
VGRRGAWFLEQSTAHKKIKKTVLLVSDTFGFSPGVQRIEQGQQNLELATLNKLAEAFNIQHSDR